jgi:hypothetical protein
MAGQSKPAALPPWGSAVAGATGAVLANAMVYPLDLYGALTMHLRTYVTNPVVSTESRQNFKSR